MYTLGRVNKLKRSFRYCFEYLFFINIRWLCSSYVGCESFLESNSPDGLTSCDKFETFN